MGTYGILSRLKRMLQNIWKEEGAGKKTMTMKKWLQRLTGVFLCGTMLCGTLHMGEASADTEDMRAVWISTVYMADYPSTQNNMTAQKTEFMEKLDKIEKLGLNTVVVQVRPKADAFYVSELNPWSQILTGTQGVSPGYDPMAFMIEETHQRGMEFHAWLNPYRVTTSGTELTALSVDHPARLHPEWVITHNNALYYDPANEEVKQFICDSVAEIVKNYDVDAIHFDDYFYPSNYPLPEGETKDGAVAEERREHVNDLICRVYETIHSLSYKTKFGISPMGVWKNSSSDPAGSATGGTEGYYSVYGDAKKWVENNWVDYIVPQIYWECGNAYGDYETLVNWWSDVVDGTAVKLYIGHGIYKDVVAAEIAEQLRVNENYDIDGSFFFSLRDLLDNRQGCADAVKAYYAKADKEKPAEKPVPEPEPEKEPEKEAEKEIVKEPEKEASVTVEKKVAYGGRASVTVDGIPVAFEVYTIDDYTYFKLRDIANALSGTRKQFDTRWEETTTSIEILRGTPYSSTTPPKAVGTYKDAVATTSTAKLYCDGEKEKIAAYTINDYTYYKLRDLAKLLDMGITWDEDTFTIGMETKKPYR